MAKRKPTLQSELESLEAIVRELEEDDLDLDRAIGRFEEGVRHLKVARDLLAKSELTVKKVLEETDGTIALQDLDD